MNRYKYTALDPAVPLAPLIHTVASFLATRLPMTFAYITYVPNGRERPYARSTERLAETLGSQLRIAVAQAIAAKDTKPVIKNVSRDQRETFLKGLFFAREDARLLTNQDILLLDDVYETGSTARQVHAVLQGAARPRRTILLAVTRIWTMH